MGIILIFSYMTTTIHITPATLVQNFKPGNPSESLWSTLASRVDLLISTNNNTALTSDSSINFWQNLWISYDNVNAVRYNTSRMFLSEKVWTIETISTETKVNNMYSPLILEEEGNVRYNFASLVEIEQSWKTFPASKQLISDIQAHPSEYTVTWDTICMMPGSTFQIRNNDIAQYWCKEPDWTYHVVSFDTKTKAVSVWFPHNQASFQFYQICLLEYVPE